MYFLGAPIEVGMTRFIIAQVLGLLTLALNFWSYQTEDQRKYFVRFGFGSLTWMGMFIAIGSQIPVILVALVSTVRPFMFYAALKADTPFSRMFARRTMYTTLAISFIGAISIIPFMRPETIPLQIALAVTGVLFIVGQYLPGVYLVRVFAVFYAWAVLLLNTPLDTFNPMGIIIESFNIIAVVWFFVRRARKLRYLRRLAAIRPPALNLGIRAPGAPAIA
ncbi:MAG: hypothetical protein FWG11_07515 [Promicromonosporaceae bacterium]|nr:hypothetical protein [Promicromonosporaceae bacterium]